MCPTISQQKFLDSEEATAIRKALQGMAADPAFNTAATYTVSQAHLQSFVDKHMKYLTEHPKVNPRHYLSNLKLMTRVKL